jgi:hypothetical protein
MSAVFTEWQPRYAQYGVATFPVKNKKPCVRDWQSVGLKSSSMGAVGRYEFLQGNLADLDRLPVARIPKAEKPASTAIGQHGIPEGERSDTLFKHALRHAAHVDDLDALTDVVRTRNMDCMPPLAEAEVVRIAVSAWSYQQEGKNLVGRGHAIVTAHTVIDELMHESPDAFLLLMVLKRHHWGRDFVAANRKGALRTENKTCTSGEFGRTPTGASATTGLENRIVMPARQVLQLGFRMRSQRK